MIKEMPAFGLGTWSLLKQDEVTSTIKNALKAGYKHIDTAQVYDNEKQIGNAFKELKIDRESIFVTSKVAPSNFKYHVRRSVLESLKRLQLDRIDLMLLHTPMDDETNIRAYKELMKLREEGIIQHVGVSNFRIPQLKAIYKATGEYPYSNQVSLSPTERPDKLEKFCKEHSILLTGYSVMKRYFRAGTGKAGALTLDQRDYIDSLAAKYGKDAGQVMNKWSIKQGYFAIPKSSNPKRIASNIILDDFNLTDAEMKEINSWNKFKDKEWIKDQAQWSGGVNESLSKQGYVYFDLKIT